MPLIPTWIHARLDYVLGVVTAASPWLFGFAEVLPAMATALGVGLLLVVVGLLTDYELSAAKLLSMETHLSLDILAGAFLVAAPWLLGFAGQVWLPHGVLGVVAMATAFVTQTMPSGREVLLPGSRLERR